MTETCNNCRFHHTLPWPAEHGTGVNHFCRLDPPEFVAPQSSALKPIAEDGWCGKWQTAPRATIYNPAPVSDPNTERSSNLSVRSKRKTTRQSKS